MTPLAVLDTCPNCGADLRGPEIPEQHRHLYGGKTHGSRVIGVEYEYGHPARYDGISEWRCPDCDYREGRWSGRRLRAGDPLDYEARHGG